MWQLFESVKGVRYRCGPVGMLVYGVWRLGHHMLDKPLYVRFPIEVLNLVVVRIIAGARIPSQVSFGPGLGLVHDGLGVVIHPDVIVGANVRIFHQVTIGDRANVAGVPIVGDGVLIGTGAKILGPVRIGDGAKIGANAVVLTDVPAGATFAGVPARNVNEGERQ